MLLSKISSSSACNTEKIRGSANLSLISSKALVEGPIPKWKGMKGSWMVSGRRTYIDILAQPFIRSANDGNPAGYYFYDLNAKLNHKFSTLKRQPQSTLQKNLLMRYPSKHPYRKKILHIIIRN